ncbi:protein IQ-DOMAIN 1 isoform X1 [Pistacia vera]|uniref:protein IQ-DOMAIN 1 isoform X1 n=2 Tax=Pistacia vera TaxID=55513 RepID=UPI001263533C|nr:protein IQ-DOMAIN 1 isoform X1 [Pistacia vera]
MGITGELVRSVFSRNRSVGTQDSNNLQARNNMAEKRKWSSVRSYLCGDEFNSVLAEEDSASVKSSEATVTQPILEDFTDKGETHSEDSKEKHNSISKLFHKEDAAIIIQTAFRGFRARRQDEENKLKDSKQEPLAVTDSPSRESVGTSIEVQTGNSVEVFSVREESMALPQRMHQKARTQIFKIKEDWDDSTVSSNVSKMRIQNRLEATTRRERALAYAFSQQLRICSKKKQNRTDDTELNMGWSWLERWMATRLHENSLVENPISKQLEPFNNNQKFMVAKRLFDVAGEEQESCGSNEVSVQIESFSVNSAKEIEGFKPRKNRLKATSVSRRKTVPSYQCPKECSKVSKKDSPKECDIIDKKNKQKQAGNKKEVKCNDASI